MFRTRWLPYENKMHAKGTKQIRESAAVSDCTKILCVRKVGEPRIRKLSAYEIFWIYRTSIYEERYHFFMCFLARVEKQIVLLTHNDALVNFSTQVISQGAKACKQLMDKKFLKLLEYILAIGNHLNGNTPRGCAYGFKVSSLEQARRTKNVFLLCSET